MYAKLRSLCAVMAQILSIYGLVAAVIMSGNIEERQPLHTGSLQFGAGIAVGLCGMAAGFAIGIVGDAGGKCSTIQHRCRLSVDRSPVSNVLCDSSS